MLNLGVKAINDTTNRVGDDFTPEFSGIFGFANDAKTFGFGVSASYAKRDSGSSSSTVNDWHIQAWDASNGGLNAANRAGAPLYVNNNNTPDIAADDFVQATIVNAPANGQLYGIPNDIRYAFSDSERERTNVQATVQFAPIESLTLTVDYTWALNELDGRSRRADHLAAAQRLRPSSSSTRVMKLPRLCCSMSSRAPARTSVTNSSIANTRTI